MDREICARDMSVFAAVERRPELSCPIDWTPAYGWEQKGRAGSIPTTVRVERSRDTGQLATVRPLGSPSAPHAEDRQRPVEEPCAPHLMRSPARQITIGERGQSSASERGAHRSCRALRLPAEAGAQDRPRSRHRRWGTKVVPRQQRADPPPVLARTPDLIRGTRQSRASGGHRQRLPHWIATLRSQ